MAAMAMVSERRACGDVRGTLSAVRHALLVFLAFGVMVAYCPLFSSALCLRWILLTACIPFLSWDLLRIRVPAVVSLLFVWGCVGAYWSPSPHYAEWHLFHYALLFCLFVAAVEIDSLDGVMTAAGWGIAVSAALLPYPAHFPVQFGPLAVDIGTQSTGLIPRAGLFFNPDLLGEAAAVVFVWLALARRNWVQIALAAACLVSVFVSGSRIALAAVAVGMLFERHLWSITRLWMLAAAGGALWWTFHDGKVTSLHHRLEIWRATISDTTPLGHGLGWFETAHPYWVYAHSDVLQLIAELGWVPVLLAVGYAALRAHRYWRRRNSWHQLFGWLPAWRHESLGGARGGGPTAAQSLRTEDALRGKDVLGHDAQRRASWGALAAVSFEVLTGFPLHVPSTAFLAMVLLAAVVRDVHARGEPGVPC